MEATQKPLPSLLNAAILAALTQAAMTALVVRLVIEYKRAQED